DEPEGEEPSGMARKDAAAVRELADRHGVRCEIVASRDFRLEPEDRFGVFDEPSLRRLREAYALVDQVILLWTESALQPRAWLSIVDLLERRRYAVLFDVPAWGQPGPKAVVIGATSVPETQCTAYIPTERRVGAQSRPCTNAAERVVAVPVAGGRQVRVALCKLHHRSHDGIDLGEEGGEAFVEFAGVSRPAPAADPSGVRPAPPRPMPVLPRRDGRAETAAQARDAGAAGPPQDGAVPAAADAPGEAPDVAHPGRPGVLDASPGSRAEEPPATQAGEERPAAQAVRVAGRQAPPPAADAPAPARTSPA
ncbi:MAG TPA: hypothetical protein VFH47_04805, partial [Candidatus Thermoplasmatota archaeon]|nr:hypothetical protein [Candidatus Thermoplasmatota archaeon]